VQGLWGLAIAPGKVTDSVVKLVAAKTLSEEEMAAKDLSAREILVIYAQGSVSGTLASDRRLIVHVAMVAAACNIVPVVIRSTRRACIERGCNAVDGPGKKVRGKVRGKLRVEA
jgi:hypothetical protein